MFRTLVLALSTAALLGCGSPPKKAGPALVDTRTQVVTKACRADPGYTGPIHTSVYCTTTCRNTKGGSYAGLARALPEGYRTNYCHNGLVVAKLPELPCPSFGDQRCKSNWDAIKTGLSEDQVLAFLGSPKRKSLGVLHYDNGQVTIRKNGVEGWIRPSNYTYRLPPTSTKVTPETQHKLSSCPGTGSFNCKANWDLIKQALPKATVETILGRPPEIKDVRVRSNNLTETWVFPSGGIVKFINGIVSEYKRPSSFEFYGPLQGTENRVIEHET